MSRSVATRADAARITWRTVARLALMALTLAFLIVPHLCYRAVGRPSPMVMAFLNAAGWIAGLRITTTGTWLRRNVLFVSNHVTWLDILALGGAARSAFVSKAEVAATPPSAGSPTRIARFMSSAKRSAIFRCRRIISARRSRAVALSRCFPKGRRGRVMACCRSARRCSRRSSRPRPVCASSRWYSIMAMRRRTLPGSTRSRPDYPQTIVGAQGRLR